MINNVDKLITRLISKTKHWGKNTLEISEMKDCTPDLRY